MDHSIRIGGEAGQGIQTIGDTLSRYFARAGFHVFTHQDYESRVRGGHNYYQVRFSEQPLTASRDRIDLLIAFDTESVARYKDQLTDNGLIVYDSSVLNVKYEEDSFFDIPFTEISLQQSGKKIMANSAATGAVLGMLGMDISILSGIFEEAFSKKGEGTIRENVKAAAAGREFAVSNCKRCSFFSGASEPARPKMLIAGNDAIGLGAVASGLKFYSAYPMTPSTGIMNYIAGKEKEYGIIVEQAEDEISAINMALGASYAGVRSMTGTSGGGFALMVEGLSLAGMTETPVVIALAQRPGPATGLPTRTEQGDLQFALYSAHGEFPRVILAPGTPEQAFYLTNRAFDLAEKYQIPVIILTDQYLADTQWTFDSFDLQRLKYSDHRLRGGALKALPEYRRHAFTDSGVTPMAVPGESEHLVVTDSDEHDEEGHIIEDSETRNRMTDKRLFRKFPLIQKEISGPFFYGSKDPEMVLAGWGSSWGVLKEVVDMLMKEKSIAMLHFSEIYPFPLTEGFDYIAVLKKAGITVCVENNATGQFARLTRTETGFSFHHIINRYDGRPFTTDSLREKILLLAESR